MKLSNHITLSASAFALLLLTGCANTSSQYTPLVDGPKDLRFQQDLAACQKLSEQREYLNGDTKSEALLGAALGALAGSGGDTGDIVGGALVGAAVGSGGRAWETRDERKNIVISCMKQRGHKVVG
ncbi:MULTISPECIES: glycine zipper family protein [Neptunomonas]|uniref:Glycine zipper family protein n=1 Tax=Neptunomonas marina TaxID=1815562 RepID=A0A437Q973_9GAMM|nr:MULTISPECIES: glycine zipper family protein [Neptunomonas]RVU30987.1 glycine zipper family protein [Neptunomonas marina]